MKSFLVALCGLSAAEIKFIEIVAQAKRPGDNPNYKIVDASMIRLADIAVVETESPASMAHFRRLKTANVLLQAIFLSDDGLEGDGNFRISRRQLLLQLVRVLDQIVDALGIDAVSIAPIQSLQERERLLVPNTSALETTLERTRAEHAQEMQTKLQDPVAESLKKITSTLTATSLTTTISNPFANAPIRIRALVVDDSASARAHVRAALEPMQIQVVESDCAESALNFLAQMRFELMVLDVTMPGLNGFDLCGQLKRRIEMAHMPIILVTSRNMPFDRARGVFSRCDAYLTKPLDLDRFSESVSQVLQKYHTRLLLQKDVKTTLGG